MVLNRNLFVTKQLLQNVRQFRYSYSSKQVSEDPDKILADGLDLRGHPNNLVTICSPIGFKFNIAKAIIGPVALFPKTILCWNVKNGENINKKTLSLFLVLDPKPDVIVIGLETQYKYSKILDIKSIFTEHDIRVEIHPVRTACGIYNLLSNEDRYVIAGLIPPLGTEKFMRIGLQVSD
ncbi:NADH dehydrogenase [ubiquinone] 1 alpha subcomplex assembly factor 3 [Colletes gigas]|uniref:NADH dehydrogenase [ubiquinone] 1 alpha subcomplex assembly factor 3 n=1 Tax=Colletes gigas TaxID=935657 RepID=UPI001C9A96E7|nr:NADH dehydrogenase [ubiquinone] 1 alpha subcomplex assembly factor 3 [Colletes gigas]